MSNTDKVIFVYAPGYNEINIPVTAFSCSMQEALEKLTAVLGIKPEKINETSYVFKVFDTNFASKEDMYNKNRSLCAKLFEHYYDGCGECTKIIVKEIESGELKIFAFDLD